MKKSELANKILQLSEQLSNQEIEYKQLHSDYAELVRQYNLLLDENRRLKRKLNFKQAIDSKKVENQQGSMLCHK